LDEISTRFKKGDFQEGYLSEVFARMRTEQ